MFVLKRKRHTVLNQRFYYFYNYNNIKMDINIDDTIDSILDFGVSERTGLTKIVPMIPLQ